MKTIRHGGREWRIVLLHGAYYVQNEDVEFGPFYSHGQIQEWASDFKPAGDSDEQDDGKPEPRGK